MRTYSKIIINKIESSPEQLEEMFPWLKEAEFEDAEIGVRNEKLIWNKGIWLNGTWENGEWGWGTWENGTWENGEWGWGYWKNGTWENGEWGWGYWENGTWKNGIWKNGEWKNGIFENGVWKDGEWYKGKWLHGEWNQGRIFNHDMNKYEDSYDPPIDINFTARTNPLKTNQISLPKEIRSIKDPTLYSIADTLVRM